VAFAQGSTQATQVAKGVKFKSGARSFEEDFTVCSLGEVDFILGNMFLHFYGVEIRQRPKLRTSKVYTFERNSSSSFFWEPIALGFGCCLILNGNKFHLLPKKERKRINYLKGIHINIFFSSKLLLLSYLG
jgi:hypothetical protein